MASKITRSPRAPSMDLEEALKKAQTLYDKESKHGIPAELAARHLGYSGIKNGAAARALASLKAFGLVDANNKGDISVSRDVETYIYTPEDDLKRQLLSGWLRSPKVYADLLEEYGDRLPSDQALRYRLIKNGFLPAAADDCVKHFKSSVQFAGVGKGSPMMLNDGPPEAADLSDLETVEVASRPASNWMRAAVLSSRAQATAAATAAPVSAPIADRIPVRLSGGRKAAIEVPTPLFAADKEILKRQIDLLFTDDEEEAAPPEEQ